MRHWNEDKYESPNKYLHYITQVKGVLDEEEEEETESDAGSAREEIRERWL